MNEKEIFNQCAKFGEENESPEILEKIGLTPEQKEIIANTTLIIPDNDGEAHLAIEIVKRVGMDVRVSNQKWGARLEQELKINPEILSCPQKTILVFEMPSKEIEEKLKQQGMAIEIIDHHQYQDDDRSKELSSLEQLLDKLQLSEQQLQKLGFDPRFVRGVAINDKSYIYGLRQAGYSEDEIRKIREFDIRAQLKDEYNAMVKRNEQLYRQRIIQGDVTILRSKEGDNNSVACDKIVFDHPDKIPQILDLRQNDKGEIVFVCFSGPTEIVQKLKQECNPSFAGSGKTKKVSDFVGWNNPSKKQLEKIKRLLKIE